MTTIQQWAQRWNIPPEALADLALSMCENTDSESLFTQQITPPTTEAGVQQRERLQATLNGGRLWRNNVGAYETPEGTWVRYGLCNDSKQLNAKCKSSDLIGLVPVVVTAAMVGSTIGRFTAIETKAPGWKYTGSPREQAQWHFLNAVNSLGGDGRFVS